MQRSRDRISGPPGRWRRTVWRAAGGYLEGHRPYRKGHDGDRRVDASRLNAAFTILLIAVAAYWLIRGLPGLVLPPSVRS